MALGRSFYAQWITNFLQISKNSLNSMKIYFSVIIELWTIFLPHLGGWPVIKGLIQPGLSSKSNSYSPTILIFAWNCKVAWVKSKFAVFELFWFLLKMYWEKCLHVSIFIFCKKVNISQKPYVSGKNCFYYWFSL